MESCIVYVKTETEDQIGVVYEVTTLKSEPQENELQSHQKSFQQDLIQNTVEEEYLEDLSDDDDNLPLVEPLSPSTATFTCLKCSKEFLTQSALADHVTEAHSMRCCNDCGAVFKTRAGILTHLHRIHIQPTSSKCPHCNMSFLTGVELNNHFRTMHKETPIEQKKNVPRRVWVCNECERPFYSRAGIIDHLHRVEFNVLPFRCTVCDRRFPRSSRLAEHALIHMTRAVTKETPAARRVAKKNDRNRLSTICDYCGKFVRNLNLKDHINLHLGLKPYACPQCPTVAYASQKSLNDHLESVHGEDVSCKHCGRVYKCRTALNVHTQKHHPETLPMACKRCGKGFKNAIALDTHKERYHGSQPAPKYVRPDRPKMRNFRCTWCLKAFADNEKLRQHVVRHTGEKNFACKSCEKRFRHYSSLYNHWKAIHAGETMPKQKDCYVGQSEGDESARAVEGIMIKDE